MVVKSEVLATLKLVELLYAVVEVLWTSGEMLLSPMSENVLSIGVFSFRSTAEVFGVLDWIVIGILYTTCGLAAMLLCLLMLANSSARFR